MREPADVVIEACVGSVADARAAVRAGANRVELCSALELGGLTPSLGLTERVLELGLPTVAMLRPRAGGFCYDGDEFAALLGDARRLLDAGCSGVACGFLDRLGRIDAARTRELVDLAAGREAVFHRAFDFAADWRSALETVVECGCRRILSSGGAATAALGAATLREMVAAAGDRIEIMAGGGVNSANVVPLADAAGCRQFHLGAAVPKDDGSLAAAPGYSLCDARFLAGSVYRGVDGEALAAAIRALRSQ